MRVEGLNGSGSFDSLPRAAIFILAAKASRKIMASAEKEVGAVII